MAASKRFFVSCLFLVLVTSLLDAQVEPPSVEWEQVFRGSNEGYSVQQIDGGFIVSGGANPGFERDAILIKTDEHGDSLWAETFAAPSAAFNSVHLTEDGEYVVSGHEGGEGRLVKTDPDGRVLWDRRIAGLPLVGAHKTADGGFILAGSPGGASYGRLVKTDSDGIEEWSRELPCEDGDRVSFRGVRQLSDGGYLVAGELNEDVLLLKTDQVGDQVWKRTFGGEEFDSVFSGTKETADGGFVIAGWTRSFSDTSDAYLLKFNRRGELEWERALDYGGNESAWSVEQALDGGYVVAGGADDDLLVFKADPAGNPLWHITFGGQDHDHGAAVQRTSDGGYIVAGTRDGRGAFNPEKGIYLIKLAPNTSVSHTFQRGDCNDDGNVDISDAVFNLGALFLGQVQPSCEDACDSNDDGAVDISDAIGTLGALFLGQGPLPFPSENGCGIDPTDDDLECERFAACQ